MASASSVDSLVLIPVLFTVVGMTFVVIGARTLRFARRFRSVAMRAEGVVTDLRYRSTDTADSTTQGSWFPVLRFTTADGRQVHTEAMYGRSPAPAHRGDEVMVLYDPGDPTRAALEGKAGGGLIGALFLGLGLLFSVVGLLVGSIWVLVRHGL